MDEIKNETQKSGRYPWGTEGKTIRMEIGIKEVADLITNMSLNGATEDELFRAIEYSTGVIDLYRLRRYNSIDELIKKYGISKPMCYGISKPICKED